jgi:hypothetical protein
MGLSIRAYARRRGVTPAAVRKALRTGRIAADADGTIDAVAADGAWAAMTAPRMPGVGAVLLEPALAALEQRASPWSARRVVHK